MGTSNDPESLASATSEAHVNARRGKKKGKDVPFDGTNGEVTVIYEDIVRDDFWDARPWLLA